MAAPDLPELHARALDATRGIVAAIAPTQWTLATPCSEWDLRALVNHVVGGNWWAAELAAGKTIAEVGDRLDGDILGDDPMGSYDASSAAAAAAFRAPGAMSAPCAVSYGPVPGETYCGHRFIDVLVHGWDIAAATKQSTRLDPELVDACLAVVTPQAELLEGSGAFGRGAIACVQADPQSRLLALLGRQS
ncbi:MAG: TIGR03086 family metal-binding protein [Acidimicrobiales bacterium]